MGKVQTAEIAQGTGVAARRRRGNLALDRGHPPFAYFPNRFFSGGAMIDQMK